MYRRRHVILNGYANTTTEEYFNKFCEGGFNSPSKTAIEISEKLTKYNIEYERFAYINNQADYHKLLFMKESGFLSKKILDRLYFPEDIGLSGNLIILVDDKGTPWDSRSSIIKSFRLNKSFGFVRVCNLSCENLKLWNKNITKFKATKSKKVKDLIDNNKELTPYNIFMVTVLYSKQPSDVKNKYTIESFRRKIESIGNYLEKNNIPFNYKSSYGEPNLGIEFVTNKQKPLNLVKLLSVNYGIFLWHRFKILNNEHIEELKNNDILTT